MANVKAQRLQYFQEEMAFLREEGRQFAHRFPKVASGIDLGAGQSRDPYTEMLIQSFAFLTGRIRMDLDEERDRLSRAMLDTVYPHLTAPTPPISITQFIPDQENPPPETMVIDRGFQLIAQLIDGSRCLFKTCYDTEILPLEIVEASCEENPSTHSHRLTLGLKRLGPSDSESPPLVFKTLRLYLSGDDKTATTVYALLLNKIAQILQRVDEKNEQECSATIKPVGFAHHEAVLPFPPQSHQGLRLLQEFFLFPEKFLFVDLLFASPISLHSQIYFDIDFAQSDFMELAPYPLRLDAQSFRLACTPVINLFEKISEPMITDEYQAEYPVVADQFQSRSFAVHCINSVHISEKNGSNRIRHLLSEPYRSEDYYDDMYWVADRHPRGEGSGNQIRITLTDHNQGGRIPNGSVIYARLNCSNGDLAESLPSHTPLFFESQLPGVTAQLLRGPTPYLPPPHGDHLQSLVSALSLNHLSLVSNEGGLSALKALLSIHNMGDFKAGERLIEGIVGLSSRPVTVRLERHDGRPGFCTGLFIDLTFAKENFTDGSAFLFATVLEHFFPLYASVNTSTQLVARWDKTQTVFHAGSARCGPRAIL